MPDDAHHPARDDPTPRRGDGVNPDAQQTPDETADAPPTRPPARDLRIPEALRTIGEDEARVRAASGRRLSRTRMSTEQMRAIGLAFELIGALAAGLVFGFVIGDQAGNTQAGLMIGGSAGIVLGVYLTIRQAYRLGRAQSGRSPPEGNSRGRPGDPPPPGRR